MALSLAQTEALSRILKPGMSIASFGYPDLIAPEGLLKKITEKPVLMRKDSEAICSRHGIPLRAIPDAHSFLEAAGCTLDVYDVVHERGCEIPLDLNLPCVPMDFDIVLDVGTAEHCFNIGMALMNMAEAVKEGGYILHENPSNWGNHGFYNLNPTLFFDFYNQNGFKVEELKLTMKDGRYGELKNPTGRFTFPDEEFNIFCMAKRSKKQRLTYPIQTKYKKFLTPGTTGERDASARAKGVVNG